MLFEAAVAIFVELRIVNACRLVPLEIIVIFEYLIGVILSGLFLKLRLVFAGFKFLFHRLNGFTAVLRFCFFSGADFE